MMEEIKPKKERKFLKAMGDIALTLFRELVLGIGKKVINKVGNKRQGLVIAFLLVAGISYASIDSIPYPVTGNKQRLGWQTSGNGLVYRGRSNDTITKPSSYVDKNVKAYLLLDSVRGTIFVWRQTYWDSILVGGGAAAFTQPVDSLFFNTGVPTNNVDTAKMRWDSDLATVVLGLNDNVPNELGFKNFWLVKNQTGSTITKGSLVYANGTVGASGRITVDKFIANGSIDAKYLLGITAHDLTDGEDGYVISFGKIRQVNTDTFAAGAILYPSPTVAGVWTDVEPVAPNIDMPIGFCINSSVNNGTIAIRVASGYKLSELHDLAISSPIEKASLYYSGGLWRDTTAALLVSDTASMLLPYLRDADTVTLSNRINLKLNIADTSAFARDNQISGTSGQVAYFNSSSSVVSDTALRWSAANKSLGINMTTVPSGANLIIKNSQEPVRTTLVANQTFTGTDTLNWTRGTGWTFNNSVAVATAATGDLTYTPALDLTAGDAYEITFNVTSYTSGTITPRVNNASYLSINNALLYTIVIIPSGVGGGFRFLTSNFTGQIDNVSVVKITKFTPILLSGQDDGAATLYSPIRMPNSTTLSIGGGGGITTGTNNLFFGSTAGTYNTTGTENNFFGTQAGFYNTTGIRNNFFGLQAGYSNTTGGKNNFFGFFCGYRNISGSENNFFGSQAGQNNIDGYRNNFFGTLAGGFNTSGDNNNFFGYQAGFSNTTGGNNNFFGDIVGLSNTTGSNNNFFGRSAAGNNTTGQHNTAIGTSSLASNTIGLNNIGIGQFAGRIIRRGEQNIAIGLNSFGNTVTADTLTGSNNIAIGTNAADNIRAAAAGNVAIGNQVDLPTNNGSNQGVYQNVLFFTGASGTGTTIAAASKAGIKTNAPNRDLEVAGEVRITDLTTDAPTRLVGADADGDLGQVTLGAGLSLASSSLLADTNLLVTRFDTASMLTNYLRTGVAASTYISGSGTANYLPKFDATKSITSSALINNGSSIFVNPNTQSSFGWDFMTNTSNPFIGNNVKNGSAHERLQRQSTTSLFYPSAIIFGFQRVNNSTGATSLGGINFITTDSDISGDINPIDYSRIFIEPDGNIGIGTMEPIYKFDIRGTLGVTGEATLLNKTFVGNFTDNTPTSGGNHNIRLESNDVSSIGFHDSGNTIANIRFSAATGFVIGGSDGTFGPHSTTIAGATTLSAPLTVNSSAVFNEGSTDSDFRVESDGNANMVFVDASTDRVGIGYASPTKTLDVNGTLGVFGATNLSNTLTVDGKTILNDSARFEGNILFKKNMGLPIVKISNADYTATTSNHTIIYTTLTADKTLTIPNASDAVGVKFVISIFDIPEGNEALTLVTPGSNLFVRTDGENSSVDIVGGYCTTIQSDGTKWYILSYAPMY